jgi:hypothetical protein
MGTVQQRVLICFAVFFYFLFNHEAHEGGSAMVFDPALFMVFMIFMVSLAFFAGATP